MYRSIFNKHLVVAIPLCLASTSVFASPIGMADSFNAYAISSFTYSSTDIQGIIGSGGDVSYTGGNVGVHVNPTNTYSIYSGGNVDISAHDVGGGGIQANGTVTTAHTSIGGAINAGGNVDLAHGSLAGNVDTGGSFRSNNNVIHNVNAQGSVSQTSGAIGAINATGDVTLKSVGMSGDVNSDTNIDITGSSASTRINVTAENNIGIRNLNLNANANAGNTFTGTSGYIQGDVAGNLGINKAGFGIGGSETTSGGVPNVQVAAHQSDAIDHAAIAQELRDVSAGYAAMGATGTVQDNDGNPTVDNYLFAGNNGLNIFDLTGDMLTDFASMTFDGFSDSTFIFNVAGTDIDILNPGGFSFNGLDESMILFNFYEAVTIDLTGSFWGTILAPEADVNYTGSGTLFGSLYANNISGDRQINSIYFSGEEPSASVPAPSVLLLLMIGSLGLISIRRKVTS